MASGSSSSVLLLASLVYPVASVLPWPPGVPDPSGIGCNLDPTPPLPPFAADDWPPAPTPTLCTGRCPSVLFIVADDARPQLGCYGHTFMRTPNMDKLAASGTLFNRAYTQYAVCSPSRNSFMTGRSIGQTQVWNFLTSFRQNSIGAGWTTLPQHFRHNGYLTLGTGKIYHEGAPPQQDYPYSWSFDEMPYGWGGPDMPNAGPPGSNCTDGLVVCDNHSISCAGGLIGCHPEYTIGGDNLSMWCTINETALGDRKLLDEAEAQNAIDRLRFAKRQQHPDTGGAVAGKNQRPFFLAVGFHRPHLPWAVPSRFFDLYPPASEIPGPLHPLPPVGMPDVAWKPTHGTLPKQPFSPMQTQLLRRALYAAMSYMDHQVGLVLDELDTLGLDNDTIVTFVGDHGQHAGEHNLWAKMTNFEIANRVPLLVRVPWLSDSVGRRSDDLVEALDLFKTLIDLAGLPQPSSAADLASPIEGKSIVGALLGLDPQNFSYAFSQYAKKNQTGGVGVPAGQTHPWNICLRCKVTGPSAADYVGYTVRSRKWRYTEWRVSDPELGHVSWVGNSSLAAVELYDHRQDRGDNFDDFENENLAAPTASPSAAAVVAMDQLRKVLARHFRGGGARALKLDDNGATAPLPLVLPHGPPGKCITSWLSCSLNGRCSRGGCLCNPGWEGPACDRLALEPTDRTTPAAAYGGDSQLPNISSWGGNAIRDDQGLWHIFVSEFTSGCGLASWLNTSLVTHATAASPTGPFKHSGTALDVFSHNVMPLRAPAAFGTGARPWYLFHIGTGVGGPVSKPGGPPNNDTHVICYPTQNTIGEGIMAPPSVMRLADAVNGGNLAHRAPTPFGPWEPLPSMTLPVHVSPTGMCNNPAPMWHPNGTLFLLCNTGQGGKPWPLFSSNNGGFSWVQVAEVKLPIAWTTVGRAPYQGTEDPYLYLDSTGESENWHLLVHRYRFTDGPGSESSVLVAGHGFSRDGHEWAFSSNPPYDNAISHTDGGTTAYTSLERPHLIIDESTGHPSHLVVAASPSFTEPLCSSCGTRDPEAYQSACVLCKMNVGIDSSFTMILPLKAHAAPSPSKGCRTDLECSLNGVCNADTGICHCDRPWTGDSCGLLGFAAAAKDPVLPTFTSQTHFSWGGSIIKVSGASNVTTYHAFFAHWSDGKIGGNSSVIVHGTSSASITGPFSFSATPLTHGTAPQMVVWRRPKLATKYVLFVSSPPRVLISTKPEGPFTEHALSGPHCGNSAPALSADGIWYLACQATTKLHMALSPQGPYSVFGSIAPWENVSGLQERHVEDPMLYIDKRNHFHIVNHAWNYSEYRNCASSAVSAHTFSRDGKQWHTLEPFVQPWGHSVGHADGTSTVYSTLERPYILQNEAGELTHIIFAADAQTGDAGCKARKAESGPCSQPWPCSCVLCKFWDRSQSIIVPLLASSRLSTTTTLPVGTAEGPCDITGSAGNPCVAAHSTTRALYGSYHGPLYSLYRNSDGERMDVGVLKPGGFANITTHDTFCQKMDCVISNVYDQSPQKNHLYQRLELVNASRHKIIVGDGVEVYGMWFDQGHGYHCDNTTGVAKGNDPESIYAVMAGNRDPSELNHCCFDYGNSENSVLAKNGSDGAGTMEAIYFGNARWHGNKGDNSMFDGPWVGADLEAGMYYGGGNYTQVNPRNKPLRMPFVSAYLRGATDGMVLKGGDATKGEFVTMYDGPRPLCSIATTCHDHKITNPHARYQPMNKKGAIILATGGDTSARGVGNFYEGMMVTGATSDATDDAVKANIVAVGYKNINPSAPPAPPPHPPAPPSSDCEWQPRKALSGGAHTVVIVTSKEGCCGACLVAGPTACRAAVFHQEGDPAKKIHQCVLWKNYTIKPTTSRETVCVPKKRTPHKTDDKETGHGHLTGWSSGSREFNCKMRELAYDYGKALMPARAQFADLYFALGLNDDCTDLVAKPKFLAADYELHVPPPVFVEAGEGGAFFVDPVKGVDSYNGSLAAPFRTLHRAVVAAAGKPQTTINLRAGRHYLGSTVQLGAEHNGLTIQNYRGERVVVSGARRLSGAWKQSQSASPHLYSMDTSPSGLTSVPGLHVDGVRATRCRYPNGNPELPERDNVAGDPQGPQFISSTDTSYILPDFSLKSEVFTMTDPVYMRNKSRSNRWGFYTVGYGGQCRIFDPPVSYWCSNESSGGGGVGFVQFRGLQPNTTTNSSIGLHTPYKTMEDAVVGVKHAARWANYMFTVKDYNKDNTLITFDKGGFQGSRGSGMIKNPKGHGGAWFVENVAEELDYPNEYFWDKHAQQLHFYYNGTGPPPASTHANYDVPQLKTLFNLTASRWRPIRDVTLRGIIMTGTRYTYMDPHGVPSGGDMALARRAAVFLQGTDRVKIADCTLTRLDGNAIMVSGWNRDTLIENNTISFIGESAVAAWGFTNDTDVDRWADGFDGTDGNHPLRTTVRLNLIHETGRYISQTGWFFQAKTAKSQILSNVMFNCPRSGITMNDGFGGGDRLIGNLLFSSMQSSDDAGPVNSWDRQPFLTTYAHGVPSTDMLPREVARNMIFANYDGQETLDHDDGTLSYISHDNVHVSGQHAFKLGQGDITHYNDLYVYLLPCTGSSYCMSSPSWSQVMQGGGPTSVTHPDAFYNNTIVAANFSTFDTNHCPGDIGWPVNYNNKFYLPGGDSGTLNNTNCKMDFSGWNGTSVHPLPADEELIRWARAKLRFGAFAAEDAQ